MKLINIPALTDNYIWLLYDNKGQCIVIDPGEYIPVLKTLKKFNLTLTGIFLTHYHCDHVNGVSYLLKYNKKIPVYGPKETLYTGSNEIVTKNDIIKILNIKFKILSLPGHTSKHIGFYSYPWLFCGDTMFSAGCGKIVESTAKRMYESLQAIKKLNKNTFICSGHEYTLFNINFALSIMPQNKQFKSYKDHIKKMYKKKKIILPSQLKNELKINIFLQCHNITLRNILGFSTQNSDLEVFTKLRKQKDNYR